MASHSLLALHRSILVYHWIDLSPFEDIRCLFVQKLITRVSLIRRSTGTSWGSNASILRTAILSLAHCTAEHCAPAWCRSVHTHLINPIISNELRVVRLTQSSTTHYALRPHAYVSHQQNTSQFVSQLKFA